MTNSLDEIIIRAFTVSSKIVLVLVSIKEAVVYSIVETAKRKSSRPIQMAKIYI